ncbi:MAG: DUF4007 family protein, partial [Fusobacteriaceae bacterium]|nr:DUF4007 family protein [Fusobacteriaceae bacterium]
MSRLPLNFHQTFIPERRYISILLEKIKDSINLNDQELSALTSIPMGSSSGKLPAMLAYAKGMGLLKIESGSERTISLTPLGKLIKEEDLFLQEGLTQWILHLELCKKTTGAELWYQVFTSCFQSITGSFTTNKLELLLEKKVSKKSRNMASPVLRTYNDDAALALVDIIKLEKNSSDTYIISNPPLFNSYSYYYGYLLFS